MSVFTRAACVVTSSSGSGKESMGPGAAGKAGSIDGLWRAGAVLYLSVGDETQGTAILVTRGSRRDSCGALSAESDEIDGHDRSCRVRQINTEYHSQKTLFK